MEIESKLTDVLQVPIEPQRYQQNHMQLQLNQISHPVQEQPIINNISKRQNTFTEREFDFVCFLSVFTQKINSSVALTLNFFLS